MLDKTQPIYEVSDVLDNTVLVTNDLQEAKDLVDKLGAGHFVWGPFPYEQRSPW